MIYFARCGHDGPIKIGHTIGAIQSRISFLQVGCPWPIVLLGTMDGDLETEAEMLRRFSHIRMRGEWFHAANDLLVFIAENTECEQAPKPKRVVVSIPFSTAEDPNEDWPAIITRIMSANGWNQGELAAALGMHQAMISKWKTGRHGPNKSARTILRSMLHEAKQRSAA